MIINPDSIYSKYGRDIGRLQQIVVKKAENLDCVINFKNQQELDDQIVDTHLLQTLKAKDITTFADLAYMCERKGRVNIQRDDIARLIGVLDEIADIYQEEILQQKAQRETNWNDERPRDRYISPPTTIELLKKMVVTKSIERIIEEIHNDFLQDLSKCQDACKKFQSEKFIDNYQDRLCQQLYLLRYLFAYSFENKEMYKDILCDLCLAGKKEIVITSLGCGSAIDLWSLQAVLNEYRLDFDMVYYNGVDSLEWDYSFGGNTSFCKKTIVIKDAADYLEEKEYLDEDIIVFPRSISDFSDDTFRRICEVLEKKRIKNDIIYCMISGAETKSIDNNIKRIKGIINALYKNNYDAVNNYTYQQSDPGRGITAIDNSLRYPGGVLKDSAIIVDCNKGKSQTYCQTCGIKRKAMLTCKWVNYLLWKFERKS